jgi:hypothetical protein
MRRPRAADKWRLPGQDAAAAAIIVARTAIQPKANFFLAEARGGRRDKNEVRA